MEIKEIITDAFEFPYLSLGTFSIYTVLSVLAGSFAFTGLISSILGYNNPANLVMGILSVILSVLIGFILSGYSISVIKSGIKGDNVVPEFDWKENFYTGINNFIVTFVYILIPTVIVVIVGYLTNVHGTFMAVIQEIVSQFTSVYTGSSTVIAVDAISAALAKLPDSLVIPVIVALILFVVFLFLQTMAQSRLANTGDLMEALNIVEAARDISRIGVGKVVLLVISVILIVVLIEIIVSFIFSILPFLSILSIIISPYLLFFTQRAIGLLYSDIA